MASLSKRLTVFCIFRFFFFPSTHASVMTLLRHSSLWQKNLSLVRGDIFPGIVAAPRFGLCCPVGYFSCWATTAHPPSIRFIPTMSRLRLWRYGITIRLFSCSFHRFLYLLRASRPYNTERQRCMMPAVFAVLYPVH